MPLPPPPASPDALLAARLCAIEHLVDRVATALDDAPTAPGALEDLSLRHLAKGAASARAAVGLVRAGAWSDACILTRAIFEQLFAFLWVMHEPAKAEARAAMVTLKQEWANAKYLEGLAASAAPGEQQELLREAAGYRAVAEALLARLAAELGTTEKKVRDEATLRVSAKAFEVHLGPPFSVPYAYYSGFVHTDGTSLEGFARRTEGGLRYSTHPVTTRLPLASDLHRSLLRLVFEAWVRCPGLDWRMGEALLREHAAWLAAADALA